MKNYIGLFYLYNKMGSDVGSVPDPKIPEASRGISATAELPVIARRCVTTVWIDPCLHVGYFMHE